ncbi:3-deoxy-7-phosphoheptulonate synthase [Modestobacter sp. VKM Ac-2979]|uniref:3-deoxy-7-phosphoheptulonate synthase n=1 Tax=unclassified Modestobacter TaxID=2643866 RepID=UPI0022ABC27E|nr:MULTISPECIES: 3-deoxy-7-phosphoheptulonate synthase [unclassified Modestobacter]MCZ2814015.1 3-deoxy-7-phosphoheptulonate synthase [Modestobacter sp. VKM Ac-2979]MCZ2844569.1 3-deoxy-7-phosphoheptulonate synthase [Modestobacter sp. VKM Ac-2980]
MPADQLLDEATRIADALLEVQTRVNAQIDAALTDLLPAVQQRLGAAPAADVDLSDLGNARITGLSVVVTPAAVATVVPLSAESAATTRDARRATTDIVGGADDRLAVIAGPCSIHDAAAALEYAAFLADMRARHGADLEILMRTYTEKPRTEVDWKGFAYDPFLDGSSRISVGLVATRMLMGRITALGVPVAAEPLNALTPQYVDGLVTYNGVGARNVTDQTARERVSGFSSVVGFKNSPEGSVDVAIQAVLTARAPHQFLGVDQHGVSAQLSTSGNDTGHVILRGAKDGPNYSAAHIAATKRALAARGLPEVLVVDASHGNSQKDHRRQAEVVRDLAGQVAGGEQAIRGVMIESNLVAGRQDLDQRHPERLEHGKSVTDACVDLSTTEELLAELAEASRTRRAA